jgi:hypothetical protein
MFTWFGSIQLFVSLAKAFAHHAMQKILSGSIRLGLYNPTRKSHMLKVGPRTCERGLFDLSDLIRIGPDIILL